MSKTKGARNRQTARALSIFFALTFIVAFSGCVAESEHPLSDPETAKYDTRLEGVWRSTFDGEVVYLHFGNRDDVSMDIITVEHMKCGSISSVEYTMFQTVIDKTHYMNVQNKDSEQRKGGYIFVKYDVSEKNTLTLWLIDTERIIKAIENGTIKGEIKTKKWSDTIKITDTTPNLIKYIRSDMQNEPFKFLGRFQKIR